MNLNTLPATKIWISKSASMDEAEKEKDEEAEQN